LTPNMHRKFPAAASGSSPKALATDRSSASLSPESMTHNSRPAESVRVLLADDNPADVLLVREALMLQPFQSELTVQPDGEQMLAFIDQIEAGQQPCPDVILLDLNLPRRTGEILLQRIRQSPPCLHVPIVIVTSSRLAQG
jgi:CheY-like chemotaxis protein